MSSLPNVAPTSTDKNWNHCPSSDKYRRSPIPAAAVYVLLALFLLGLCVSVFFLIVIRNGVFFVLVICISTIVAAFLLWNSRNAVAVYIFLRSFPDSDLSLTTHGQLVKITGVVCCGNISLESSYEKVYPCVYTSTLLYEHRSLSLKPSAWRLAYSERLSTDFFITDIKSGNRVLVKAGPDSKIAPLIIESTLIKTTTKCRLLSSNFRKWLTERKISGEARSLCLKEGCIKEGSSVSVMGILHRDDNVLVISQPQEVVSTGCMWSKLLIPVDIQGLVIGVAGTEPTIHTTTINLPS